MLPYGSLPSVLAVDDDEDYLRLLARTLGQDGCSVTCVTSGGEALRVARENPPGLILLDVHMDAPDGYETCRLLKADSATADIPVIFLTADPRNDENVARTLSAGGCDFLTKPFRRAEVLLRAGEALRRVSRRSQIQQLGIAEPATGLPDRAYVRARLDEELIAAGPCGGEVAVILGRIDQLDHYPESGEAVVRPVLLGRFAALVHMEASRHDVTGWWDCGHLALVLPRVAREAAIRIACRMSRIWREVRLDTAAGEICTTASFGVTSQSAGEVPTHGGGLLGQAADALELARQAGGDRVAVLPLPNPDTDSQHTSWTAYESLEPAGGRACAVTSHGS